MNCKKLSDCLQLTLNSYSVIVIINNNKNDSYNNNYNNHYDSYKNNNNDSYNNNNI